VGDARPPTDKLLHVRHEHPKLAVTANPNGEAFGVALERAIARSGNAQVINNARLIEGQSVEQS
jgi:hypothetical protein